MKDQFDVESLYRSDAGCLREAAEDLKATPEPGSQISRRASSNALMEYRQGELVRSGAVGEHVSTMYCPSSTILPENDVYLVK